MTFFLSAMIMICVYQSTEDAWIAGAAMIAAWVSGWNRHEERRTREDTTEKAASIVNQIMETQTCRDCGRMMMPSGNGAWHCVASHCGEFGKPVRRI